MIAAPLGAMLIIEGGILITTAGGPGGRAIIRTVLSESSGSGISRSLIGIGERHRRSA